jgi:drug/metabolite transporter (DMT)-like permease
VSRRALVLFALMCLIWGIPYLLIRVAVGGMTPASLVFIRTAIGSLLLVPLALGRRELRAVLPAWRPLLAYTVVEIALPWLLLSDAETKLSSSLSGLMVAMVPLIGALLAWLTRSQHRLSARQLLGLVVGLAGVSVLVGFDISARDATSVVEVVLCCVGYATGPMIISRSLASLPPVGVIAGSLLIAAVGYAPAGIIQLGSAHLAGNEIAAALTLGVVCTALAFILFFALIAEIGPVRATIITYFNPAVALLLGVIVLGEPLTGAAVGGFALILAGSYLSTRRPAGRAEAPAASAGDGAGTAGMASAAGLPGEPQPVSEASPGG